MECVHLTLTLGRVIHLDETCDQEQTSQTESLHHVLRLLDNGRAC